MQMVEAMWPQVMMATSNLFHQVSVLLVGGQFLQVWLIDLSYLLSGLFE